MDLLNGKTGAQQLHAQVGAAAASMYDLRAKLNGRPVPGRRALAASTLLLIIAGTTAAATPALAATKPPTLQSLGRPSVTANCKGGSYRAATSASPMTTISGKKWTSGFSLTGSNCNTVFTWQLKNPYTSLKAVVELDISDSGPLQLQFRSGNVPIKFQSGGKTMSLLSVTTKNSVQVPVRGVRRLSIVLPNAGSDAGILAVTSNSLT